MDFLDRSAFTNPNSLDSKNLKKTPVQEYIHNNNITPQIDNKKFNDFSNSLDNFNHFPLQTRYKSYKNERQNIEKDILKNINNDKQQNVHENNDFITNISINTNSNCVYLDSMPSSTRKINQQNNINWTINQMNYK